MVYKTSGVCSSAISFEIDDAGKVHDVKFQGGCSGNTQGVARLVEGMDAKEAISRMEGIRCGFKPTSCPDQLAKALKDKTDFQDDIAQVFLDPAEFGEEIDIDGTPVTAVIEEGHGSFSTSSGGGFADPAGLALQEATRTLYVADILPRRPVPEQMLRIDGEEWQVAPDDNAVALEMGLLKIRVMRPYS